MCIVSLAWKSHPRWKLVIIGNRDELHDRPTEPLRRWQDRNHLIAGRDIKAGGTWLGVSEQGRFAVVTNVASGDAPDPELASRGDLLKDFLTDHGPYKSLGTESHNLFNPFNLITITGDEAILHTNRPQASSRPLDRGIHGLSNGALHTPWPKSQMLNDAMKDWLNGNEDNPNILFETLADRRRHRDICIASDTAGTSPRPEHSPVFIANPTYGTRCSTLVTIDHQGIGEITERRFGPNGVPTGETRLAFNWPI